MTTTITVVLVDDHPMVRAGLAALIDSQPDLEVVGEAHSAQAAVATVGATAPDVVLMDLSLGEGPDGIEATARVTSLPHPPRVVVLTTHQTDADVLAAMEAGASGYLLKGGDTDDLFAGIRDAHAGRPALAPTVVDTLVRRSSPSSHVLTDREVEVLTLLAEGLSNRQLAGRLYVSEATVKSHLAHLYQKLGVRTRAGAVAAAIERRVIRPPGG